MKNIFLLLICSFVLFSPIEILALIRMKRGTELNTNHHRIKQDFVKLKTAKNYSVMEATKYIKANEKEPLPGNILESISANTTSNPKIDLHTILNHNSSSTKKRGINSSLDNILREHKRKSNEHHVFSKMIPLIHDESFIRQKTFLPMLKAAKRNNDFNTSINNRFGYGLSISDMSKMFPLDAKSANIVGIIAPQPIQPHNPLNHFAPIDEMLKIANMLMFKVGMDSMSPYDRQSTQMTFSPNMLMSHNRQYFSNSDIDPGLDFLINSIEDKQANSLLTKPANNFKQSHSVVYAPPVIFKKPNEPKQLIDFIENTIDSVLSKTTDDDVKIDGEIEVHCPIHHGKISVKGGDKCLADEVGEQGKGNEGGVIQICSCRFIKKLKKDVHKEPK